MNRMIHPMGTLVGDPLPGAPELAARGSVPAGVRTLRLTMPDGADIPGGLRKGRYARGPRQLTAEVWYPARPGETDVPAMYTDYLGRSDLGNLKPYTIQGRAFRDAAPDPEAGPLPVVVISHGFPGSRILLVNLAENLSGKGFVVVSIGHTGNTYEDFLPEGAWESALVQRSADQRFVIGELSRLNGEGFLKGLLQPENVGLIGFSMGGYGALRTVGARWSAAARARESAISAELEEPESFHGLKAVKAAVLFAPAVAWLDPERTEDLGIPTLWFCGTADKTVGYGAVRAFCESADRSERFFVSYTGCGHNAANNPPPPEAQAASWELYKRWGDPVWDTRNLNCISAHFVTAFLDLFLKGDGSREKYLAEHASGDPDLPGFTAGWDAGVRTERLPRKG